MVQTLVHENLQKLLYHVREFASHALLKCKGCIAQLKGHATVGECPKRTGKRCLLLFGVHRDMVIAKITIQEAIVIVPS